MSTINYKLHFTHIRGRDVLHSYDPTTGPDSVAIMTSGWCADFYEDHIYTAVSHMRICTVFDQLTLYDVYDGAHHDVIIEKRLAQGL